MLRLLPFLSSFQLRPTSRLAAVAITAVAIMTAGCAQDIGSATVALDDPDSLLDDLNGGLQLRVIPAEDYMCSPALGSVVPDARGSAAQVDAVVDIAIPVINDETTLEAAAEVALLPGDWVVTVYGEGTDPGSGETVQAGGCATISIGAGETREAAIMLRVLEMVGACGDSVLGPLEQCDDGNQDPGDGCSDACLAEPRNVLSASEGTQRDPVIAWSPGSRGFVAYSNAGTFATISGTYFNSRGEPLTEPNHLAGMRQVRQLLPSGLSAAQGGPRTFIAYGNGPTVEVAHFEQDSDIEAISDPPTGFTLADLGATRCVKPIGAVSVDGAALILATCTLTAGGNTLIALPYAAGSDGPSPPVSIDLEGLSTDTVAMLSGRSDYMLTYVLGGALFVRYIDQTGTLDAPPPIELATGVAAVRPAISATTSSGEAMVVYQSDDGTIRGALIGADATVLSTDLPISEGPGTTPIVVGGTGHFMAAWISVTGSAANGEIRARLFNPSGTAVTHRGPTASTGSFVITPAGASQVSAASNGSFVLFTWWEQSTANGDVRTLTLPLP